MDASISNADLTVEVKVRFRGSRLAAGSSKTSPAMVVPAFMQSLTPANVVMLENTVIVSSKRSKATPEVEVDASSKRRKSEKTKPGEQDNNKAVSWHVPSSSGAGGSSSHATSAAASQDSTRSKSSLEDFASSAWTSSMERSQGSTLCLPVTAQQRTNSPYYALQNNRKLLQKTIEGLDPFNMDITCDLDFWVWIEAQKVFAPFSCKTHDVSVLQLQDIGHGEVLSRWCVPTLGAPPQQVQVKSEKIEPDAPSVPSDPKAPVAHIKIEKESKPAPPIQIAPKTAAAAAPPAMASLPPRPLQNAAVVAVSALQHPAGSAPRPLPSPPQQQPLPGAYYGQRLHTQPGSAAMGIGLSSGGAHLVQGAPGGWVGLPYALSLQSNLMGPGGYSSGGVGVGVSAGPVSTGWVLPPLSSVLNGSMNSVGIPAASSSSNGICVVSSSGGAGGGGIGGPRTPVNGVAGWNYTMSNVPQQMMSVGYIQGPYSPQFASPPVPHPPMSGGPWMKPAPAPGGGGMTMAAPQMLAAAAVPRGPLSSSMPQQPPHVYPQHTAPQPQPQPQAARGPPVQAAMQAPAVTRQAPAKVTAAPADQPDEIDMYLQKLESELRRQHLQNNTRLASLRRDALQSSPVRRELEETQRALDHEKTVLVKWRKSRNYVPFGGRSSGGSAVDGGSSGGGSGGGGANGSSQSGSGHGKAKHRKKLGGY